MWNTMNDICGINRIAPFQGFCLRGDLFRRALPYANDLWAFSPINCENNSLRGVGQGLTYSFILLHDEKLSFEKLILRIIILSFKTHTKWSIYGNCKAESLTINSVGQRPTKRIVPKAKALKGRNQLKNDK